MALVLICTAPIGLFQVAVVGQQVIQEPSSSAYLHYEWCYCHARKGWTIQAIAFQKGYLQQWIWLFVIINVFLFQPIFSLVGRVFLNYFSTSLHCTWVVTKCRGRKFIPPQSLVSTHRNLMAFSPVGDVQEQNNQTYRKRKHM